MTLEDFLLRGVLLSPGPSRLPPRGLEELQDSLRLSEVVGQGDAKSGAAQTRTSLHEDAKETDLARLVEAWPTLSADVQAAILALMDGSR
jgi:hypothetical protein